VLYQVGTVAAARAAEAAGADILITQGIEAGGHVHGRTGAFSLAGEILRDARVPVVVSGGIADGGGLVHLRIQEWSRDQVLQCPLWHVANTRLDVSF